RFQRVGKFVDVQHLDSLKLRYLIQIEVVGDDLAFVHFGEFDQLQVHFADSRKIIFHDLDLEIRDFLQALQNVESPAPPISLERIGGVRHQLQLTQYELRGDDDSIEEAGLSDVSDTAIDDHAGIENFVALFPLLLAPEDPSQCRQVQQIAFVGPDDQTNVGHQQHDKDLKEALGMSLGNAAADDEGEKIRPADAEDTSDGRSDEPLQADRAQLPFEQNDRCTDARA